MDALKNHFFHCYSFADKRMKESRPLSLIIESGDKMRQSP